MKRVLRASLLSQRSKLEIKFNTYVHILSDIVNVWSNVKGESSTNFGKLIAVPNFCFRSKFRFWVTFFILLNCPNFETNLIFDIL